jgi:acetyltransferase-like isoleucine patch superfamily enzyme
MRTVNLWKRLQWRRRGVRIHVAPGAQLVLGDAVTVGRGTRLTVNAGTLRIGDGAHIGERCSIVVQERVDIASGARIADWVSITDVEPVFDDPERPVRLQGVRARPVVVGEQAVVDLAANLTAGASVAPRARVEPHEVR